MIYLFIFTGALGNKRSVKITKKRMERSENELCISISTLFQRINLPRWATLQKVKICLNGFNPVTFCVFNGKSNTT